MFYRFVRSTISGSLVWIRIWFRLSFSCSDLGSELQVFYYHYGFGSGYRILILSLDPDSVRIVLFPFGSRIRTVSVWNRTRFVGSLVFFPGPGPGSGPSPVRIPRPGHESVSSLWGCDMEFGRAEVDYSCVNLTYI